MPNAESKEEREKRLERERRHQARVAANGGEPPLDVPEISWALRPPLSGLAGQPVGSLVSVMVVLRKDSKKEKNTYPMLEKLRVKVVGVYDGDTQVFEVELQGGGKTDNVIHVHRLDKHGRPTDREDKTKKAVVFFTFDGLVLPPLPLRNFAFRAKCKLNNDSVAWDHALYRLGIHGISGPRQYRAANCAK